MNPTLKIDCWQLSQACRRLLQTMFTI